jgi:hypothetical protein
MAKIAGLWFLPFSRANRYHAGNCHARAVSCSQAFEERSAKVVYLWEGSLCLVSQVVNNSKRKGIALDFQACAYRSGAWARNPG